MVAKYLCLGVAAFGLATAAQAQSSSVNDATGDFLASYTGPHQADLDVTSLSVTYNASTTSFLIQSTFAGAIDPSLPGFYAIGVNTGTGAGPFASIGAPDVKFNQVIAVQKAGTATVGATSLSPGSVLIGGNALTVMIPLSLLPTTGFDPAHYAFNIWPRSGPTGGLGAISDFAPNNATLAAAPVPEPAAWAMMLGGFGLIGGTLRRRRTSLRFV
jgi:hypothetical protein